MRHFLILLLTLTTSTSFAFIIQKSAFKLEMNYLHVAGDNHKYTLKLSGNIVFSGWPQQTTDHVCQMYLFDGSNYKIVGCEVKKYDTSEKSYEFFVNISDLVSVLEPMAEKEAKAHLAAKSFNFMKGKNTSCYTSPFEVPKGKVMGKAYEKNSSRGRIVGSTHSNLLYCLNNERPYENLNFHITIENSEIQNQ